MRGFDWAFRLALIAALVMAMAVGAARADGEGETTGNNGENGQAAPAPDPFADPVPMYVLRVDLDPANHALSAKATIALLPEIRKNFRIDGNPEHSQFRVPVWLQPGLAVSAVSATCGGPADGGTTLVAKENGEPGELVLTANFARPVAADEPLYLIIEYAGNIHDPIQRDTSLTGDSGDSTSGIIGEQGVYLAGGGGWYPEIDGTRLAGFTITASIPAPMAVVTQGKLHKREEIDGKNVSEWRAELPTPGLSLVAGKYTFASKTTSTGIEVTAAFFESEAALAPMFLDYAVKTIETYTGILGEFPFSSFHIVENFFATGYGMPGFTLLGNRLVAMGPMAMMPGMLDHEIVHSWWGCSVYSDHAAGNWCESFTAYFTNYYAHELANPAAATAKLRDLVMSYNITVPPGEGIPLKDFTWRATPILGAVGYTKGAMLLHYIRALAGDENFFATMKTLARAFRGKYMHWNHVRAAFREFSGVFGEWLERADIPNLEISANYDASSGILDCRVKQLSEPAWTQLRGFEIAVEFLAADGSAVREPHRVGISRLRSIHQYALRFPNLAEKGVASIAVSLRLANGQPILRRLVPAEYTACMGTFLSQENVVVVLPAEGDEFAAVAENLAESGAKVIRAPEATPEALANAAVMLLGTPATNAAYRLFEGRELVRHRLIVRDGAFVLDGEPLVAESWDVLVAFDNPFAPGRPVVAYVPYSRVGVPRTRMIFHYRWDSLVLFANGRPERRESFDAAQNRCRVEIALGR